MARMKVEIPPAPEPREGRNFVLDKDLRGHLETHDDVVTRVTRPVSIEHIGALSAQSETPVLFENVIEKPGFRVLDIMLKHRPLQARALGVSEADYLKTLAFRLRQPPRPHRYVDTGPVKEVVLTGDDIDIEKLPASRHSSDARHPQWGCMNILKDPETGFCNSMHALTTPKGPRSAISLFVTPHATEIIRKYIDMGLEEMPIAYVIGTPPAYEIMTNFSGLHMDSWGEVDMFGTIMDQDVEMVRAETVDLYVPAHAEIVVEGVVKITEMVDSDGGPNPLMYSIPRMIPQPAVEIRAVTMRADRPIWRNFQTVPETDHQVVPRLCHEAVLYNRLTEMGVAVKDVRFPPWGGAMSCILQIEGIAREGLLTDALMMMMSCPWNNAKLSVVVSEDTDIDDPGAVYHAMATRCDPELDSVRIARARGSAWDPSARPIPGELMNRVVGKLGLDATIKRRHDATDFEYARPVGWGEVRLRDVLD